MENPPLPCQRAQVRSFRMNLFFFRLSGTAAKGQGLGLGGLHAAPAFGILRVARRQCPNEMGMVGQDDGRGDFERQFRGHGRQSAPQAIDVFFRRKQRPSAIRHGREKVFLETRTAGPRRSRVAA